MKPRKKNFRLVIKKYRGLSEPTPIPAHIEVVQLPAGYADGIVDPKRSIIPRDWLKINREYNDSWKVEV